METRIKFDLWRLPLLSAVGIIIIIYAQVRWFDEPVFSTRTTFEWAVAGMLLVFSQGWRSHYEDWQPLIGEQTPHQHQLGLVTYTGLGLAAWGVWRGIQQDHWLDSSISLIWSVAAILILLGCLPGTFLWGWLKFTFWRGMPRPEINLNWHIFAVVLKWTITLIGIRLCLLAGWRGIARDTHAVYLLKLWGAGSALTVFGLIPTAAIRDWGQEVWHSFRHNRLEWIAVLGLLVAALVMRIAWLETQPYIQAEDEAAFAIQAVDLVNFSHWIDSPFRFGVWHHPMVYHMLQVASIQTIGQTVLAARLPSAVLGALTVPVTYWMARQLFNWRVAMAAALFMVTYPFHVHFSRISINQVGDPLFTALAFGFLTRGLRRGQPMDYALAGVALGMSQYFYSAARIVPLLMIGYVVLYALLRSVKRPALLGITAILAALVSFPMYYSVYRDTDRPLSPRLDQVAIFETGDVIAASTFDNLQGYWEYQFAHAFGAYVHRQDESGFYGVHNPVLGWFGGVPFLIGVAVCLRRWRDPRWLFLPLWVAATAILGGVLLVDPPHYPRYVSVVPGLAALVGLGIVFIAEQVQQLIQAVSHWQIMGNRKLYTGLMVSGALVVVGLNLNDYVYDYLPKRVYYGERTANLNSVARIMLREFDLDDYELYYLSSGGMNLSGSNLVRYQTAIRGQEYMDDPDQIHELPAGDYLFVASHERWDDIQALAGEVPWGDLEHQYDGDDLVAYTLRVTLPQPSDTP